MQSLPDHFTKADRERLIADWNRIPKGPHMNVENGVIQLQDLDGKVTSVELHELSPTQIVLSINGKKVVLDPKSSYVKLRKQLLQEIQGSSSASFSLGLFPEAQAVTIVGAIAIFAAIVSIAWLGWSVLRNLWRCFRSHLGNRRIAPGQLMTLLKRTGQVGKCVLNSGMSDAEEMLKHLQRKFLPESVKALPQVSSAEEQQFLIEEDGVVVAEALKSRQNPATEEGSDATARLWKMFEPTAQLFSVNVKNFISQ